jgi:hypothetical protein
MVYACASATMLEDLKVTEVEVVELRLIRLEVELLGE